MGRPERSLPADATPLTQFAGRLRALRVAAGEPSYRRLAAVTHYSAAALARAAGGQALPSLEVTLAYVAACGGDPDRWQHAWDEVAAWVASQAAAAAAASVPETAPLAADQPAVPRQLPAGIRHFVGRAGELATLAGLLDEVGQETPGTVVISAIDGTAGVGKTAMALHWAHQVADEFPDGQLYMNLCGFDPSRTPIKPEAALRRFLESLGIPADRIPADLEALATLYRTRLADRRMLVLLDNAFDAAQVRPLLPGSPGSLVVVTSRSQLTGLAVTEGASQISLDVLTSTEARELLCGWLGVARVGAEGAAVAEITGLCARLPLALAITAARAVARPDLPLSTLAAELRRASERLDVLATGDTVTDVRAVFSWSYHSLGDAAARMFRLIGLHPGPDISASAAASLAGLPLTAAKAALWELTGAHLLTEHAPGRFTFHDLLRAYACEQASATDSDAERQAASHRMLDHYLQTGCAADRRINPSRARLSPLPVQPGVSREELTDHQQALAWFEAERQVLLALPEAAAAAGFDAHAWQIAWACATFLQWRGHWSDGVRIQRTALAAARRAGDLSGQANACYLLALVVMIGDAYGEASVYLSEALALWEQLGDPVGQGRSLFCLARVARNEGDYAAAIAHAQRALGLYRAVGDRGGQTRTLNAIGWYNALLDNYEQALAYCQESLALQRESGYLDSLADTLDSIGYAHSRLGHHADAIASYQQALDASRRQLNRRQEADTLIHLGDVHASVGHRDLARDAWQQALSILDELGRADADQVRAKLGVIAQATVRPSVRG